MSNDPSLGLEPVGEEVLAAYVAFGLNRARQGLSGLEWAFGGHPEGLPPLCVARTEGRIVGLSSNIPGRIKLGDREGRAFQAVDSYVSEEARGQGLFTRLAAAFGDAAGKSGVDVIWGFPNRNAAPAWFGKLGWTNFGQVPFLIRPLRAAYILRRLRLPGDLPLMPARVSGSKVLSEFGSDMDDIWARFGRHVPCALLRDAAAMNRRIFEAPERQAYRVATAGEGDDRAIVVSRIEEKHGGRIGYILEAIGGAALASLLRSELSELTRRGAEIALAWCFPWSPNFPAYRSGGFLRFPERLRPVEIHFGARAYSDAGAIALARENWYLSYLDSDGV